MNVDGDDLVHSGHLQHPRYQLRGYRLPLLWLFVVSSVIISYYLSDCFIVYTNPMNAFISTLSINRLVGLSKKFINANLFDTKNCELFRINQIYQPGIGK